MLYLVLTLNINRMVCCWKIGFRVYKMIKSNFIKRLIQKKFFWFKEIDFFGLKKFFWNQRNFLQFKEIFSLTVYQRNISLIQRNCFLGASTKVRPQAKIDHFAFKNSNIIIEGLIWKRKDYFPWKIFEMQQNNAFKKFYFYPNFFFITSYQILRNDMILINHESFFR